jgi:uncharacterized protein
MSPETGSTQQNNAISATCRSIRKPRRDKCGASPFAANGATMVRLFETRIAMIAITPIDYSQLSELLQDFGALLGAAEVHGFLVGQLATGKRFSRSEWLRAANEQADLSQSPDEVAGDRLYDLYRGTLTSLQSGELSFQLLLPEDDDSLPERVESLAQWCQGFLTGFGLAGSKLKIDSDLAETLRDLSAIAQVGASEDEAALESSESDLFSICEYVRLTVVEIFWGNNSASSAKTADVKDAPSGGNPADLFKRKKLH